MFKKVEVNSTKQGNVNHAIVIDRSGSMTGLLPQVIEDVKAMTKEMKVGDTFSAAWFSTENGEYDWFIKNHLITPISYDYLAKTLDGYKRTVGLTCFSEVLQTAQQVFDAMPKENENYLTFLTDGHPVTSNNNREEKKTLDALRSLRVDSAVFIGYGGYYNKPFMVEMTKAVGGTLVHAGRPVDIQKALADYVSNANPMVEIEVEGNAFYFSDSGVYNAKSQGNKAFVPQTAREVYFLSNGGELDETATYGYASLLLGEGKADEAMQLLAKIGDVRLVDAVANAFTNEELGNAQAEVVGAVFNPSMRFTMGKNTKYLPADDAYCLLNLLEDLNQEGVYFLPRHKDFKYNRIGAKREMKPGFAKFEEYQNQRSPFTTLVYHGSQANVSLSATIKGEVDLGQEAELYGLPRQYPCVQIRNYAIVKDGILNIKCLPVIIPDHIAAHISMGAEFDTDTDAYVLDLTSLPIINRNIANQYVGRVSDYLTYAEEELVLEAGQKVYRYYRDLLNPNKTKEGSGLTEQQQIFLREKGIVNGVYSPPTLSPDFEDVYLAKEILFKKAGYSSLPSVPDVIGGKKNGPAALMRPFINDAINLPLADIEERLASIKKDLKTVRRTMQLARFAIVVGHKWFNDVSRDAKVGDWTIQLREKEVKF